MRNETKASDRSGICPCYLQMLGRASMVGFSVVHRTSEATLRPLRYMEYDLFGNVKLSTLPESISTLSITWYTKIPYRGRYPSPSS